MVDLKMLDEVSLRKEPICQSVVAWALLTPNYHLLGRVEVVVEGIEQLPDGPVIFAMNHTDRYNYWPFQYHLWHVGRGFTATWVKAKYFEHPLMRWFMLAANNIPTVSRGYLITKDFLEVVGRPPEDAEYEALRASLEDPESRASAVIPTAVLDRPRDVLGLRFEPSREPWAVFMRRLFREMMLRFVGLNAQAMDRGLDLIIFPQGTRSVRLSRGHMGLGAIALASRATVVPVGCSGSNLCYPGSSPWARDGRIVYRIGAPITYAQMARHHIDVPFVPLSFEAEEAHRDQFQGYVDEVMERINGLLDPPYRFSDDQRSDGVKGARRFV